VEGVITQALGDKPDHDVVLDLTARRLSLRPSQADNELAKVDQPAPPPRKCVHCMSIHNAVHNRKREEEGKGDANPSSTKA
jgi:hypothetical protein